MGQLLSDCIAPAKSTALSLCVDMVQGKVVSACRARGLTSTAMLAKKKGKGGQGNEGAQPRERKEKDDVIEAG